MKAMVVHQIFQVAYISVMATFQVAYISVMATVIL